SSVAELVQPHAGQPGTLEEARRSPQVPKRPCALSGAGLGLLWLTACDVNNVSVNYTWAVPSVTSSRKRRSDATRPLISSPQRWAAYRRHRGRGWTQKGGARNAPTSRLRPGGL